MTSSAIRSTDRPARLFTRDFLLGTFANLFIALNYYTLMVVMADRSMETFGVGAGLAGLSASIFIIGEVFARVLCGAFMDRIGLKRVLVAGAAADLLFTLCYLVLSSFPLLLLVRILHGFFYGVSTTAATVIATSLVPDERKGEGVGYFMLSMTLGSAIGPFLGMALTGTVGFGVVVWVCVAASALCLVAGIVLHVPEAAAERRREDHASAREADGQGARRSHLGLTDFIEPCVLPIALFAAITFFAYSSLLTFLHSFSVDTGLTAAASMFFVVYSVAMFVARPFTGKLFDRRGHRVVMIPAFIVFAAGMVVLSQARSGSVMLLAAAILGVGLGTIQPSGLAMAVQKAPDDHLSLANSTYFTLIDIGVGVGPLIMGLIVPFVGYRGLYLCMAPVVLVAFVCYLVVARRSSSIC